MEELLQDILAELRAGGTLDDKRLAAIVRRHNKRMGHNDQHHSKKKLLPFYLRIKHDDPERWRSWNIDPDLDKLLLKTLQAKPRRTASGVATITVITKPWTCSSNCIYCPSDLRMPKSYLHNEPACQRAERNFFDPYLQVTSRLHALTEMGHITDKVELIVLGGTWTDYPEDYQVWFIRQLFSALNDAGVEVEATTNADVGSKAKITAKTVVETAMRAKTGTETKTEAKSDDKETSPASYTHEAASLSLRVNKTIEPTRISLAQQRAAHIRAAYHNAGFPHTEEGLRAFVARQQDQVNAGALTFNQAFRQLYGEAACWKQAAVAQTATWKQLEQAQHANETAAHRCVGLVVETRPDCLDPAALTTLRRLGCTKIQMGIQSLDPAILQANRRRIDVDQIASAFAWCRLLGFKTHAHFMVNLLGATPAADKADYARFVNDPAYRPDEVKLYPCALVESAALTDAHADGRWQAYTEEELLDVLVADTLVTPPYTRISRMIRDISAGDIIAGNKKTNLRQMVEQRAERSAEIDGAKIDEMRHREISTAGIPAHDLHLDVIAYDTTVSDERFLQWVTPDGHIAGFLRLSLPHQHVVERYAAQLPVAPGEAMIREVHVYGKVAGLGKAGDGAQHLGLGKKLVQEAERLAREAGYRSINVISAIGTREYYRHLGFQDTQLYLRKQL